MPRTWIALTVNAPASDTRDLLIAFLWKSGASGFVEDDASFTAYLPADEWKEKTAPAFDEYCARLHAEGYPLPRTGIEAVEDRNWNLEWEKTIKPVRINDRLLIRPSWDASPLPDGTIAITIDPKMSFGTGYHETTRLMLRLLDRTVRPGNRVLDIGTGTGILAIASIKLGASFAIGVDNDDWSYDNALENVRVNEVENFVTVRRGSIGSVPERDFDVVMANIHFSVIVEMLDELVEHLARGAHLLLSGVLESDEESLRRHLASAGCLVEEIMHESEWIGISAIRPAK